jgi:hypothetical protein
MRTPASGGPGQPPLGSPPRTHPILLNPSIRKAGGNACASAALSLGRNEETTMLYTLAVILLVLWLLGFVAFHVGGGLIHLLLVIAVVVVVYQLITGRRAL